ncbi:MAG TPA: tetratricopeptide repeat protein [Candidatus Acidoferrales bacterium]|nr:tetratricopeptide repeat protein [Candidatus Acidoferrales bacterium]
MAGEPTDEKSPLARAMQFFRQAYEHQMRGELDEAVRLYTRSIEAYPTAEGYTFRGWVYSFQGKIEEAIEECKKAIEVDPTFGNPYNDIGAYLVEQERLDEAIPWLEKALVAPRYESYCFPHVNLGRVYEKKRMFRKAMEHYREALEENPKHLGARRAVARLKAMSN